MLARQEVGKIKNIASLCPTLHSAAFNVYVGKININTEMGLVADHLRRGLCLQAFTVPDLQNVACWMRALSEEAGAIGWDVVEPAGGAIEYLARSIGRTASFEALTLTRNSFGGVRVAKVDPEVIHTVMGASVCGEVTYAYD